MVVIKAWSLSSGSVRCQVQLSDIHCSGQTRAVTCALLQHADEHILNRWLQPETSEQSAQYPREVQATLLMSSNIQQCVLMWVPQSLTITTVPKEVLTFVLLLWGRLKAFCHGYVTLNCIKDTHWNSIMYLLLRRRYRLFLQQGKSQPQFLRSRRNDSGRHYATR
jgi:hypothetical protein